MTFPKNVANVGNVFNGDTGIFTSPVNGYYEFTFTGSAYADGYNIIRVEKNGSGNMKFLTERKDSLMSFTWIMELSVGDEIRLFLENGVIYRGPYRYNFFNGMLLHSI